MPQYTARDSKDWLFSRRGRPWSTRVLLPSGDTLALPLSRLTACSLLPTGPIRWSVTTPAAVEVSPAIATNGIVIFGSNNRLEYGVNPDGRIRRREKIGNYTYSSPIALPSRRVVFGNHSGQMTILDTDTGHVVRRDTGDGELWTSAAVDAHGDLYFASRTGGFYGFNPNGRRVFAFDTNSKFDTYPALAPDGTLLLKRHDATTAKR